MMKKFLRLLFTILLGSEKTSDLALENLALRQQVAIMNLMPRRKPRPPSQTWRTFLKNHMTNIVSIDFFTVPTATFRILFVLVILSHSRRKVVHFNVTSNPTAMWTAQQLVESFPWDTTPKYLLRDRDSIYGLYLKKSSVEFLINGNRDRFQVGFIIIDV